MKELNSICVLFALFLRHQLGFPLTSNSVVLCTFTNMVNCAFKFVSFRIVIRSSHFNL